MNAHKRIFNWLPLLKRFCKYEKITNSDCRPLSLSTSKWAFLGSLSLKHGIFSDLLIVHTEHSYISDSHLWCVKNVATSFGQNQHNCNYMIRFKYYACNSSSSMHNCLDIFTRILSYWWNLVKAEDFVKDQKCSKMWRLHWHTVKESYWQ